jgi:stage II sporulation protein D
MLRKYFITGILLLSIPVFSDGQVRIRLFSASNPQLALFTVTSGKYDLNTFVSESFEIAEGENVIFTELNNRLFIKIRSRQGIICDSAWISSRTGNDSYSLRINGIRQYYSGDLHSYRDLGSIVLIDICDIESYIAGVVKAEGGSGKSLEYFKSQAVIARTYMYKYFNKHITDRFNLCDNTHCQVFNGISDDTTIIRAALETKGEVILGPDSILIIAAFHSNCGGETSPSENVWLTSQSYLKKVTDPFCTGSRNARWQTSLGLEDWTEYLARIGYTGGKSDPALLDFSQKTRLTDFKIGNFSVPLTRIRNDLKLRSTFFSISADGDSVIFSGRGYGHGVGLCQEGAMMMAVKGFDYKQIINFYYAGVIITDIGEAKEEGLPNSPLLQLTPHPP